MREKEENVMDLEKIAALSALADRYLYLKEKCERIYEKLTIAGHGIERVSGISAGIKERILTVYAETRQLLARDAKRLAICRTRLCDQIQHSESITPEEKKTLLMRLDDRSIREIAISLGRSDGTIVKRIKRCGVKLFGSEDASEEFYNCLSRLREASKEEEV